MWTIPICRSGRLPAGLAETLRHVWGQLEVHMKKTKELMVFPAMRRQRAGPLTGTIREMRHDHNDHAAFLDQIVHLTDDYTPPQDACRSWQALHAGVAQFRADLMEHVHRSSASKRPYDISASHFEGGRLARPLPETVRRQFRPVRRGRAPPYPTR